MALYFALYLFISFLCMCFVIFMSLLHFYDGDHRVARAYVDKIYWCLVWPIWAGVALWKKN